MKISKKDALAWFEFFAQLPEGEQLLVKQQELVYAAFAQIEAAVIKRNEELMAQNGFYTNLYNSQFAH